MRVVCSIIMNLKAKGQGKDEEEVIKDKAKLEGSM